MNFKWIDWRIARVLEASATATAGLVWCAALTLAADAPRVVSINTCTDQLVLALAEPHQILGLSRFSRHAEMSFLATKAVGYPRLRGSAEEVLRLAPDAVFAGAFSGRATREFLAAHRVTVETFPPPRSIGEAKTEIMRAASLLQQEQRGQRLIADIDSALARAALASSQRPTLSVLAIQRRTFVSGQSTLISRVLQTARLDNAATRLGIESIGQVSLEALIKSAPDALVVEGLEAGAPDQSTAVLHHPVLARSYPPSRRIALPVAEVTCGGPSLPALIDRVTAGAGRLRADRVN
jgi:iron complex transport system substrate-binding protein